MPKAFSEQERVFIQKRLLEQGEKLFALYGLKKTTVEELASAAGISKAAFYLFYVSKEALFMDVVERAEERFRGDVLAAVELPGPSPRARLLAVLRRAFSLWKTLPILQYFTRVDYDQLSRRIPPEKLAEHQAADRRFIEELAGRCRAAGIPFKANPDEVGGVMYTLFFAVLHEDDFGPGALAPSIDILLQLVAAYCLGEVEEIAPA